MRRAATSDADDSLSRACSSANIFLDLAFLRRRQKDNKPKKPNVKNKKEERGIRSSFLSIKPCDKAVAVPGRYGCLKVALQAGKNFKGPVGLRDYPSGRLPAPAPRGLDP
jgi:hypothetical protein